MESSDIVITLLTGAFVGWAATLLLRNDGRRVLGLNVLVGVMGAGLVSWLCGHVLQVGGAKTTGVLHVVGLLWGVAGACLFIAVPRVLRVMR